MPDIHVHSIAVCIQALQDAISYYDLLCQSPTVDPDDHEETKYIYELELARLSKLYEEEEKKGAVPTPLASLLKRRQFTPEP